MFMVLVSGICWCVKNAVKAIHTAAVPTHSAFYYIMININIQLTRQGGTSSVATYVRHVLMMYYA